MTAISVLMATRLPLGAPLVNSASATHPTQVALERHEIMHGPAPSTPTRLYQPEARGHRRMGSPLQLHPDCRSRSQDELSNAPKRSVIEEIPLGQRAEAREPRLLTR